MPSQYGGLGVEGARPSAPPPAVEFCTAELLMRQDDARIAELLQTQQSQFAARRASLQASSTAPTSRSTRRITTPAAAC